MDVLTPASQLDPLELYQRLLTSWQECQDREALKGHLDGVRVANLTALEAGHTAITSMGLSTLEPYRVVPRMPITLLRSQLTDGGVALYGQPYSYGSGLLYGQPVQGRFTWPVPSNLVSFDLLVDQLYNTTRVLDPSEVQVQGGRMTFTRDPFTLVTPTLVTTQGVPDQQVTLWAVNARVDDQAAWYRFGAQVQLPGVSSSQYTEVLRAYLEILQQGWSLRAFRRGLQAACGLPVVAGGETVERIDSLAGSCQVTTNLATYRYPAGSTVVVQVGQTLEAAQEVVDTIQVQDQSGQSPLLPGIQGIALGAGDIGTGPVTFPNAQDVWQYRVRSGVPEVTCTIFGTAPDIQAFWDRVLANGMTSTPLATRLGITSPATTQAVNPAGFLVQNLLGANLVICTVRPAYFGTTTPGFFTRLAGVVPRWTRLLFDQQLGVIPTEVYDPGANTTDTAAVYPAAVGATVVASPSGDDVDLLDYTPLVTVS